MIKTSTETQIMEEEEEFLETDNADVDALLLFGYTLPEAIEALETTSDVSKAHRILYQSLTGSNRKFRMLRNGSRRRF